MGSKTTMTTGESSCLISFAMVPLVCSERRGNEKFKMKISVSSRIRTHDTQRQVNQRFVCLVFFMQGLLYGYR